MLGQMHRRSRSFWQWSAQEWCDVVGVTAESFEAANGLPRRREGLRPQYRIKEVSQNRLQLLPFSLNVIGDVRVSEEKPKRIFAIYRSN